MARNEVVDFLLENNGRIDLNMLVNMKNRGMFTDEDWKQFCELIDYNQ